MATDKYVNTAFAQVTESAANTLTFDQIQTGIALMQKVAWKIERIEWYWGSKHLLVADDDYLQAALVTSNQMTGIALSDPAVVDLMEWHVDIQGTAASAQQYVIPEHREFTALSGGGLLIPANPLFICAEGSSLGVATTVSCRIRYTLIELKADEYWQLLEGTRFVQ